MRVGLTMQLDNVLINELAPRDGSWAAVGQMRVVEPGQRVGHVPYERLRAMGDGEHELLDDGPLVPCEQSRHDSLFGAGGWFFFATVALLCSPMGYSFFDSWEAHGGRIRIHWVLGLIYGLGGKLLVAVVFSVAALILAVMGIRSLLLTASRWRRKLTRLEDAVAALRDQRAEQRMTVCNPATGHALWVLQREGSLQIVLPEQYLTPRQVRKAATMLESSAISDETNTNQVEPATRRWYVADAGDNPHEAARHVVETFHKIYGLHPSCEMQWELDDVLQKHPVGLSVA